MAERRAVFLDRDGTLIADPEYLADPDAIEFVDGAFEALRLLREHGYLLVVVTNQSGIARGLYSLDDYHAVAARMSELLAQQGIVLDGVFYCPHHPDFTGPCDCRKPGLGLYRDAARNLGIDLASSAYVGDRLRDVLPAIELGGRGFLVRTGAGSEEAQHALPGIDVVENVLAAAYRIVGENPLQD